MSDVHEFSGSNDKSKEHNKKIDKTFSQWYEIYSMPLTIDKIGIDRIWKDKERKVFYSVEYKADERAADTGNAFIETISVDTSDKPGWAYTCAAQLICYYVPRWHRAWMVSTMSIKNNIKEWEQKYRTVSAQNNGYKTYGIAVPWDVFVNHSYENHEVIDDQD